MQNKNTYYNNNQNNLANYICKAMTRSVHIFFQQVNDVPISTILFNSELIFAKNNWHKRLLDSIKPDKNFIFPVSIASVTAQLKIPGIRSCDVTTRVSQYKALIVTASHRAHVSKPHRQQAVHNVRPIATDVARSVDCVCVGQTDVLYKNG